MLAGDQVWQAAVLGSLASFENWISRDDLFFFPEYTDHGPKHISAVLETCGHLIAQNAWTALTTPDVGALVIATLLHDSAMHLTGDGFQFLVAGAYPAILHSG